MRVTFLTAPAMKLCSAICALFLFATALRAAPDEPKDWAALPPDIAKEVDDYFTSMDLALNNNRIELVMALYTPDATEEIQMGAGAKFDAAKIRERRQADMLNYARPGGHAPVISRSNLSYHPGPDANSFLIRYTLFRRDATGTATAPSGEIVYTFKRGERGILVQSLVARQLGVTPPPVVKSKYPLGRNGLPTEVELTNGVVLHHVTVAQWQPDKVVLKHLAGSDPIKYDRMIPEQRELFEAQREQGLEFQKQNYARAAAVADLRQQEKATELANAQAREALAEQIDTAISEHRLLVGMTMDQVKRSWGLPTRTVAVDGTNGQGVMWVYDGRGMDTYGNVTTAGIGFIGDAVVQLFNVKGH